MTSKPVG
jgi:hypothetical protein